MLLSDVFENFRDLCLKTYGLDPNYYYTAPGMSFNCCLKITKVELELLSDNDQIMMIEGGLEGDLPKRVCDMPVQIIKMFLFMTRQNLIHELCTWTQRICMYYTVHIKII